MRLLARSLGRRASVALTHFDVSRWYDALAASYADVPLLHVQHGLPFAGFEGPLLTGAQIRDLGFKVANALAGAGVCRNDRVVIAKRNHADYLFYVNSTVAAGAVPVAVNGKAGWGFISAIQRLTGAGFVATDRETLQRGREDPELARLLEDPRVSFLLVSAESGRAEADLPARVRPFVPEVDRAPTTRAPGRRMADDTPFALFHTSGTTGVPKCCIWNQRNVGRIWRILAATLPVTPEARGMITAPCSHQLYFAVLPSALLSGVRVHVMSDFDARECLETIGRERITHYIGFPYTFMRMASEDPSRYDLSSMKLWCTGADKGHAAHIRKFIRQGAVRLRPWGRKGSIFVDTYGSTEIGVGGVVQVWGPESEPEPCVQGKPLPTQFELRIVDTSWQEVPRGTVGRILVRSSTYFGGYWNQHDRWAESRYDGWWWAGDVGKIDARGRLCFFDREEDTVRCAEGPVYTLPVEEALLMHPNVMEAAVYQTDTDPATGKGKAAALVVPHRWLRRGQEGEPPASQRERLARELLDLAARRTGPRSPLSAVGVIPLSELPLGLTGKVLKRVLRERSADLAAHLVHEGRSGQRLVSVA
ncbi:MAG: long-chain fatty acid--CoA ligase [Myxococcales bacterium]|nr:long-chain fatty acid--CoA ligase [Myxococcales bacterium]